MENIKYYYRISENFHRYTMKNEQRVNELKNLYALVKEHVGHETLDLACGGGILDFILENDGKSCTGIDINPDMIDQAEEYARLTGSKVKFFLGDITQANLTGKYDTFFLVGNAIAHFNAKAFVKIINRMNKLCKEGSTFIVDYRDVVNLFYERKWKKRMVETKDNVSTISITLNYNSESGEVKKIAWQKGKRRNSITFTHAVWSPFIVEAIMNSFGWELVKRVPQETWQGWLDVYRHSGSRISDVDS
ncbi:MAG: class I SAM-dependent methyltransferase [Nitrososphaeria archaeon]